MFCRIFFRLSLLSISIFFFFNDTATTEIYTLSLHDALPICPPRSSNWTRGRTWPRPCTGSDRKSTRLNSSHDQISYAVFCLKKKNIHEQLFILTKQEVENRRTPIALFNK